MLRTPMLCLLALVLTVTAQTAITINNAAGGGGCPAAPATTPMSAMGDKTQGPSDHFHCDVNMLTIYETLDYPPFSSLSPDGKSANGFIPELFEAICASAPFKDITCNLIRDEWSNVWRTEDGGASYPGVGMMDHWYDGAYAFHSNIREHSFAFTTDINPILANAFLAKADHASEFISDGTGEKIGVICGYGDTATVISSFPKAEVHDSEAASCATAGDCCASDRDALIKQVRDGEVTIAWMMHHDATALAAAESTVFKVLGDKAEDSKIILAAGPKHLGFMFDKKRPCKSALWEAGLAAIAKNGDGRRVCDKWASQGVVCSFMGDS